VEPAAARVGRNAAAEADRFARATLRPNKTGRVKLIEIPAAYRSWCGHFALRRSAHGETAPTRTPAPE